MAEGHMLNGKLSLKKHLKMLAAFFKEDFIFQSRLHTVKKNI